MRTKTLLLTAALSAAGMATSKAQVYSINAVGYVNTTVVKGYNLISNPLDNKTSNKIKDLFAALPPSSQIYKFDSTTGKYDIAQVDPFGGGVTGAVGDQNLMPGEGVFVLSPEQVTITFVGEVPTGALSNPIPKGLSIRSSQVPQAGKVSADLGYTPEETDQVFKFNTATQKYDIANFAFGSWDAEPTIEVGQAVFISSASAKNWTRTFNINQ